MKEEKKEERSQYINNRDFAAIKRGTNMALEWRI